MTSTDDLPPLSAEEVGRLEHAGQTSAILGIIAMVAAMVMPCSYYMTGIFAIGFGLAAMWFSNEPRIEGVGGAGGAYANVGFWTGLIATVYSALLMLFICTFIVLYIAFIGAMVGFAGFQ